ncbi:MAG: transglutaminase domain-containing protein [Woeseiaceae bacterium]|nr:transglutaminase domain-containing protein [Woeseiaceae bacterium]
MKILLTLQPPQLGSNSVDEFLFRTQRGFCEHYASAFAVMMRAAGLPARIVLGYQGGELNPMADHVTVRQSDAHAWTEVWLEGRGWVRVDPTAAVAPERIESGMSGARLDGLAESWGLSAPAMWMHRLQLSWDALNARWNEWVLGYGPDNQNRFMQWLGMEQPDWRKMLLTLLALIMLMIAAISVLLFRRYRPPQPDAASALYRRFTKKAGLMPARGETPVAFAARLSGNGGVAATSVDDITNTYLAARYGPSPHDALERLRTLVDAFPGPDRPGGTLNHGDRNKPRLFMNGLVRWFGGGAPRGGLFRDAVNTSLYALCRDVPVRHSPKKPSPGYTSAPTTVRFMNNRGGGWRRALVPVRPVSSGGSKMSRISSSARRQTAAAMRAG